jgi:3-dehydroquinate dehydratase-2
MKKKLAASSGKDAPRRILIASGVNLDLLGQREPEIYGHATLSDMEALLRREFDHLVDLHFLQSNVESMFLEALSGGWDGAVINPGAWTHTSLALADRLAGVRLPFVEVHLSNTTKREAIRHFSYCAPHALGIVQGFGIRSYLLGLSGLLQFLDQAAAAPRED